MIFLVDGTPGAGKSYFAVKQIADAVAAGKIVVTNVPLSDDWAWRVAGMNPARRLRPGARRRRAAELETRVLVTRSLSEALRVRVRGSGEGRAVMVLDEAHTWLNSRMWSAQKDRGEIVSWFSGHRHLGFDVYLISQHIEDIDKQVRNRVEYRVRLRNLKRVRVAGVRIFPCNVFAAISELVSAKQAPTAGRDFYLLNRRIAGMYDTHGLSEQDVPADAIWLPRIEAPADADAPAAAPPPPSGRDLPEAPEGRPAAARRSLAVQTVTAVNGAENASQRSSGPRQPVVPSPRRSLSVTGVRGLPSAERPGASPAAPDDRSVQALDGPGGA